MSELMVSLAVVVGAILAVLLLAFSGPDKPATMRRPRRRGARPSSRPAPSLGRPSPSPPARVFQQQLALPARPAGWVPRGRARPAPSSTPPARQAVLFPVVGELELRDRWARVRSSVALLFLLTVVGTTLAAAIGTAMFLAGLALRDAVR